MVARLKLKGIDGRAPPGVNNSCSTFSASGLETKLLVTLPSVGQERPTVRVDGNILKLLGSPKTATYQSLLETTSWPG